MAGLKGRRIGGDAQYAPDGIGAGYVPYVSGGTVLWLPPGATGQVLTSNGAAAPSWEDSAAIPPGGATGQILTKQSAADFDADWEDPGGSGAGGGSTLTYTTNLAFYYKASNATRTGSRITALPDDASSPGGVTLTQGTQANQPYYLPNRWNGQPFMLFDGSRGLTAASSPMTATNNFTVFCVAIPFGYVTDASSRWAWINGTGANGYGQGIRATGMRSLVGGVADRDTTALWFPMEPQIVMLQRSSGTMSFYRSNHAIGGTNTDAVTAPTAFRIGDQTFVGAIAEVIGYNAVLGSTDRATVFADLGAAYNIPVE